MYNFINADLCFIVITWNGDISYINKETDKERKEASKRAYSQLYDDEMDRGKVRPGNVIIFQF